MDRSDAHDQRRADRWRSAAAAGALHGRPRPRVVRAVRAPNTRGSDPALGARCLSVASSSLIGRLCRRRRPAVAERRVRARRPAARGAGVRDGMAGARDRAVAAARRVERAMAGRAHGAARAPDGRRRAADGRRRAACRNAVGDAFRSSARRSSSAVQRTRLPVALASDHGACRRHSCSMVSRCGSGTCRRCTTRRSSMRASTSFSISVSSGPRRCSGGASCTAARDASDMEPRVVYLFVTAVHGGVLGALLTVSPRVWYAPYLVASSDAASRRSRISSSRAC